MRDVRDRKTKICPKCGRPMYKDAITCKKCVPHNGEHNTNWKGGISTNTTHYRKIQESRYPERAYARQIVKDAIKRGKLIRQPCEVCGEQVTDAHHDDYSKPLNIRWLCKKHHRIVHGGMRWYRAEG